MVFLHIIKFVSNEDDQLIHNKNTRDKKTYNLVEQNLLTRHT